MLLKDKSIIITGASSGIGAATARLFARHGANLTLGARRSEELALISQKILDDNGNAVFLAGDVTSEEYARKLVNLACSTYGHLNGAFNNAGTMGNPGPIENMSAENWRHTLVTNLDSAFYLAKHQIPALKAEGGSMVFTSSFVGTTASFPGMGAYAAAKAGLIGLAQTLAIEHGADNIRVTAMLPGGTNTPMAGDIDTNPDHKAFLESLHALKRIAEPTEIANAALFLMSDLSSFVTGSPFIVDGGNSINKT